LSLREASKLSGVSHTHIQEIEDGRSVPSFEMAMTFLWAYGVDIEVFLRVGGIFVVSWGIGRPGSVKACDSMEMEFREGDIIVINPCLKPDHNDYVVIANEEGEATFKQLKKYGKMRVLHPLNPKYDDMELNKDIEYRIVGVVMEKKKRYR